MTAGGWATDSTLDTDLNPLLDPALDFSLAVNGEKRFACLTHAARVYDDFPYN